MKMTEEEFKSANRLTWFTVPLLILILVASFISLTFNETDLAQYFDRTSFVTALGVIFLWWPQRLSFWLRRSFFYGIVFISILIMYLVLFFLHIGVTL